MKGEVRSYPSSCLSAYCGRISTDQECQECDCRPRLDSWKKWVEETDAKPVDPIWSPTAYIASR